MPTEDLAVSLPPGPIPSPPSQVVVGIPADLLRRRPDVRAAERVAAAQSARIGIAEADLYPRFAITGSIGLESEQLGDLFDELAWIGNIGPGMRWNILNYGRIRNSVRAEEAKFHQAVLAYQNSVLLANKEVEDGIVGFLKEKERVAHLEATVEAARRAVELANLQYREGRVDFQRVLDSQRVLVLRQEELAGSRGRVNVNLVAIYKALGGGWEPCPETIALESVVPEPAGAEELPPPALLPRESAPAEPPLPAIPATP